MAAPSCTSSNWLQEICTLKTQMAEVQAIIQNGGLGTLVTYWGRSTEQSLNGTQVQALARSGSFDVSAGSYPIDAGSGYWFLVVPESIPAPLTIKITSSGVDLPLAVSPGQPAYNQSINGKSYASVVVNGQPSRMYRSFNTMAGADGITVT